MPNGDCSWMFWFILGGALSRLLMSMLANSVSDVGGSAQMALSTNLLQMQFAKQMYKRGPCKLLKIDSAAREWNIRYGIKEFDHFGVNVFRFFFIFFSSHLNERTKFYFWGVGALLLGGFGDNKTKKIQKCKNLQNVVKRLNALFQKTDFVRDFFSKKIWIEKNTRQLFLLYLQQW